MEELRGQIEEVRALLERGEWTVQLSRQRRDVAAALLPSLLSLAEAAAVINRTAAEGVGPYYNVSDELIENLGEALSAVSSALADLEVKA